MPLDAVIPAQDLQQKLKRDVYPFLAPSLRGILEKLPKKESEKLEEIRLRQNRPLILRLQDKEFFLDSMGHSVLRLEDAHLVTKEEVWKTVQLLSQGSVYAFEEEFRQGYLTLPGGHRVGIVGKTVLENGAVKTLKEIGSLNFRIARAVPGAAVHLLPYLLHLKEKSIYHTLIMSPPRAGKTTVLRDLVRHLSCGIPAFNFPGINVGIVDERGEIAACYQGVPQHELGPRVDVLDHCPKAAGMLILLRSMSPQVIATDEIGRAADAEILSEMVNAGVGILATVHAGNIEELESRPYIKEIMAGKIFQRYFLLSRKKGPGTLEKVWDGRRNEVGCRCSSCWEPY